VIELAQVKLAELVAADAIEVRDAQGNDGCAQVCTEASQHIAKAVQIASRKPDSLN
jgi:hypothetical protein